MGKEDLTLLFAMPACEYFQSKILEGSVMVDDDGNTIGNSSLAFLCYAGYWNHCIANGLPPKKTISDFLNWIEESIDDDVVQGNLLSIAECFRDSKSVARFKDRADKKVDEAKKKLLTGTMSSDSVSDSSASAQASTGE